MALAFEHRFLALHLLHINTEYFQHKKINLSSSLIFFRSRQQWQSRIFSICHHESIWFGLLQPSSLFVNNFSELQQVNTRRLSYHFILISMYKNVFCFLFRFSCFCFLCFLIFFSFEILTLNFPIPIHASSPIIGWNQRIKWR